MELSLVLWNCDGTKGKTNNKASVPTRQRVFNSTYVSWQKRNMIPTVLLAQELNSGGLTTTWRDLSKKSNSFGECHAACFFLKNFGNETTFLDIGDLTRIMDSIPENNRYNDGIGRIHCSIVTIVTEKILICSWHGQHKVKDTVKKESLRKLLIFVDKIKSQHHCVAVLVGGDFNLSADEAKNVITNPSTHEATLFSTVVLYDDYRTLTENVIDYVIAWPKNIFILRKWGKIKTVPKEKDNADPKIFDHALIRYDFTVKLKGEWEGDGEVTWCGESGEGKVTLRNSSIGPFSYVKINGVVSSGQCEGSVINGHCRNFEIVKITSENVNMRVTTRNGSINVKQDKLYTFTRESHGNQLTWECDGKVNWKSIGAIEVYIKGDGRQIVEWNGTGSVKWRGKGKASWVGGKLEKWNGNQTVKWADDHIVRWSGGGKVKIEGGELKHFSYKGNWTALTEFGVVISRTWCARKLSAKWKELEWKGQGVSWEVTGEGTGEMM